MIDLVAALYLFGWAPFGSLIFQLVKFIAVIAVTTLIGQMLQRDETAAEDAKGIKVTENPTDPNAPPTIVYGEPWHRLPLLMQYVSPADVNTSRPSEGQRVTRTFYAGAGPNDGSNLRIRAAGAEIFGVFNSDSPTGIPKLSPANAARTQFVFPTSDVIVSSVVIYLDGTFYAAAQESDGEYVALGSWTTVSDKPVSPRTYTRTDDKAIPTGASRYGGPLVTTGQVSQKSIRVKIIPTRAAQLGKSPPKSVTFDSESSRGWFHTRPVHWFSDAPITVPEADIHIGTTDAGARYFWIKVVLGTGTLWTDIKELRVTYDVRPAILLKKNADGILTAYFPDPVGAAVVVTATYKTQAVSEDFAYVFRKGDKDQDPVAFDEDEDGGARNTYNVGLKMTNGTARTYSSTADVDDIIITLESGSDGFYALLDSQFRKIARRFNLYFKETSAADALATTTNDPSTGWVQLDDPSRNAAYSYHYVEGQHTGLTQWFRSIADCFEFTKNGTLKAGVSNFLKLGAYDVKVQATDDADTYNNVTDTTRFHSELYFSAATELQRIGFVLPFHGDITIQYAQDDLNANELIEASFRGRKVWSPTTAATYSATLGYPTPGQWKWSRNPVECAVDHIVDKRFGGGRFFTWADIDLTSFIAARDYCDGQITFEDGVTEARSEVDVVLAEDGERRSLGERIADILAGSEVLAYWRGTWKFVIDQAAAVVTDPVAGGDFTINEEDELEQATLEVLGIEQIPTELSISFRDREKDGADENEPIVQVDPQPTPRKVERIEFPGVQRRRQVRRVGRILLQQKRLQTKRIGCVGTFGKGLRLLQLEPGDVVRYTSTRMGFTAKRFRVFETGWASDMKPVLLLVEYDPAVYSLPWQGPNSAVTPGQRPPPPFGGGTNKSGGSGTSSGPPSSSSGPTANVGWGKRLKVGTFSLRRIRRTSGNKQGDKVG